MDYLYPFYDGNRRKRKQDNKHPDNNPKWHSPEDRPERPPFRDKELRSQTKPDGNPEPGIPEHACPDKRFLT